MMCHTVYTHNFIHHQRQQKNKEKSGTNVLLRVVTQNATLREIRDDWHLEISSESLQSFNKT